MIQRPRKFQNPQGEKECVPGNLQPLGPLPLPPAQQATSQTCDGLCLRDTWPSTLPSIQTPTCPSPAVPFPHPWPQQPVHTCSLKGTCWCEPSAGSEWDPGPAAWESIFYQVLGRWLIKKQKHSSVKGDKDWGEA